MKASKYAGLVATAVAVLMASAITGCGGLPISLSATPNPGVASLPLSFTVQMKNTLTCDAVDPIIVFVPLVDQTPQFDEVCQFLGTNNLDALCGMIQTQDQANAAADACCRLMDFQTKWPTACSGLQTGGSVRDHLQSFPIMDTLNQNSVQVHADFSASATTALGGLSCSTTMLGPLPALDCTGTLAPGDTATAALTVTPTTPGHFGTIAVAFARADPCGIANVAEGGACLLTDITVPAPAPMLSGRLLIILAGLLVAIAFFTLAPRRRRNGAV